MDGEAPGAFELLLLCYDAGGKLVSTASGALRTHVPQADLAKLDAQGIRMRQVISVPDHGEYWLRIGVHDLRTNYVGSLEVPIAAIERLSAAPE